MAQWIWPQQGLLEHGGPRAHIGIKRMGELDPKAFSNACKQIFSGDNAEVNAALLCSKWEAEIKKPEWHPFDVVRIGGKEMVQKSVSMTNRFFIQY